MLLPVCMSAILFSFNIGLSLFAIFVFINKFLVLAGNESNSYSNIFRGMKIFGGVQAFQMAVSLLRGKFVAMFLGPAGMGVSSLFASSASAIQQLASLGVPLATAREVALKYDEEKKSGHIAMVAAASRLATFITGALAALCCLAASRFLSLLTFGSDEQAFGFAILGAVVWLQMAGANEIALMQGMRELKRLGRSSVTGAAVGLCLAVPMYYLWGTASIVPAMLVMAAVMFVICRYNCGRALRLAGIQPGGNAKLGEIWNVSKSLLGFGVIITLAGTITQTCIYFTNVIIKSLGTMAELGYYSAAMSISNQCVTMIFAAMAMDYFPRLTACIGRRAEWLVTVRRQAELVALVAAPIAVSVVIAAPFVVDVLLTETFAPAISLLQWMAAGVFLRSLSYPLGYVILAKGNKMLYLCLEGILCNIVFVAATCGAYWLWGKDGLGIASIIIYGADMLVYYCINRFVYGFSYGTGCMRKLPVLCGFVTMSLISVFLIKGQAGIIVCWLVFAAVCAYSLWHLRKMLKMKIIK